MTKIGFSLARERAKSESVRIRKLPLREFTVLGIPCLGLNGGPVFRHSEAFSFQIATENQEETDRYWNAIVGNGGKESPCGWCKDPWGLSWQITPR
jgi:predicted 3-demethylubiquinone-9 3-methyltransferase (glyoxalase superfamily)